MRGVTFGGTERPAHRWCHAATELDAFAMVTYRVDADLVAEVLPAEVVPDRFTFDDGTEGALVSAVPFLDRDFHFRFFPLVKVGCGQVNYRAYVTFRGERGVWFFGTSLDSVFVALPRFVWQMPWHRDRIRIDHSWSGDRCLSWSFAASGWGAGQCRIETSGEPLARLDGFTDLDETLEVLTHPMVGWYQRQRGGLGRYSVWHPVLALEAGTAPEARFAVFERLGLVEPAQAPHSAVVARSVHFDVHTPPTRVRP